IANNVRIDFQCFAGGIAFGVGAIFFLVYNGLMIGTTAGHLTQLGYITTFWGFVSGHSAFELTGAALSGAAGLKLGYALVAPGNRSRLAALKESAATTVGLLYGAAALTFLAAFIEAFWSPNRSVPFEIKVGVGIALWIVTWAYLLLAGRRRDGA
ncbi:MAG: stage II sporulation protein M, partial [Betaproteobacteria bacterium]